MPGMKVVRHTEDYLYARHTSHWFRFVDDVEFLLERDLDVVHVRSASRVGYSDLGANRKRVERIRAAFLQAALL